LKGQKEIFMLNYKQSKSGAKEILTYLKRSHEVNEDDIYTKYIKRYALNKSRNKQNSTRYIWSYEI